MMGAGPLITFVGYGSVLAGGNAGHVKNGRAAEPRPSGAEWLVHLLECGLLRGWLIPPATSRPPAT